MTRAVRVCQEERGGVTETAIATTSATTPATATVTIKTTATGSCETFQLSSHALVVVKLVTRLQRMQQQQQKSNDGARKRPDFIISSSAALIASQRPINIQCLVNNALVKTGLGKLPHRGHMQVVKVFNPSLTKLAKIILILSQS